MSAALATALFPGTDPIGRRVQLGGQSERLLDVIGRVADAKLAGRITPVEALASP